MTIVVCEDDKDLLGLIELIIEDLGYDLITCSDDVALRQVMEKNKSVDLLIVDYWLKKTKADAVITEIKEERKDLPIILMSAISDLPEVGKRLGVSDYIKKPFNIDLFRNKINIYINK